VRWVSKIAILAAAGAALLLWLPPRLDTGRLTNSIEDLSSEARAGRTPAATGPQFGYRAAEAVPNAVPGPSTEDSDSILIAGQHVTSSTHIVATDAGRRLASTKAGDADARRELAMLLQRELQHAGCYGGVLDGDWGPGSKRAMTAFLEHVNASLPVEEPDLVLLTLLQNRSIGCTDAPVRSASLENSEPAKADRAAPAPAAPRAVPYRASRFTSAYDKSWRERVFER